MAIKSRGEFANQTDTIQLRAEFRGPDGSRTDLDSFPQFSVIQPSGNVVLEPTTLGVYRISTGLYGYDYDICYNCPFGVYTDVWQGTLNTLTVYQTFNFVVQNTQLPAISTDGYLHIGEAVPFNLSQNGLLNINKVIQIVRNRLNSSGKARLKDDYGNIIYTDCDIFTSNQLAIFSANALSEFNEIPHFTWYTWEYTEFFDMFAAVISQNASLYALASKVMLERGREFDITDNGTSFRPPGVSDVLQTQYSTELSNWFEKTKLIKQNMKSQPLGLGGYRMLGYGVPPQIARLRHLRARQLF